MADDWKVNNPSSWLEEARKKSAWVEATTIDADGNWLDLLCPKCECKKIKCKDGRPDLGNEARCYECGYEFTITGNCWKLNQEMNEKYDA
jgi:predicted RNA-binding Zn-ribbon protein involved in translation (DUF1610 family)